MNYRYLVQIQFINSTAPFFLRVWDINEPVKTLKEAQFYKSIIDKTVNKARIVDQINETIVETWK